MPLQWSHTMACTLSTCASWICLVHQCSDRQPCGGRHMWSPTLDIVCRVGQGNLQAAVAAASADKAKLQASLTELQVGDSRLVEFFSPP